MRLWSMVAAMVALVVVLVVVVAPEASGKGGTPITSCGQVVQTNAFLTQDLHCGGTDGVVVGADGITIDLKGFALIGGNGGFGVSDDGYDRVTVTNGIVRNFVWGVYAFNQSDKLSLPSLVVSGNGFDGVNVDGDSTSVASSIVSGNAINGVVVHGDSAKIQSTMASGNTGGSGFYVHGDSAMVQSSSASGNDNYGIFLEGDRQSVKASTVNGNGFGGIRIIGNAASVKGNRADANGFADGHSDLNGLGINVTDFPVTPPTGMNTGRGNDSRYECFPDWLC
jgi:hypothetical protein